MYSQQKSKAIKKGGENMIINIYTIGKREKIAENIKVKSVYSDVYYRNMPTLSAKRCRDILNRLYPHFKADNTTLVFEDVKTGYTGLQTLYRRGTILNF